MVGSGPSGFYSAKYLLRSDEVAELVMLDRLPTPFGLVRYGVAPDHPEVKNVIDDFSVVATDERFHYLGNLQLSDRDQLSDQCGGGNEEEAGAAAAARVSLPELRGAFDAVVLAYGADDDRKLGIPGEDLPGVLSARAFVNWYNGHPEFAHLTSAVTEALARCPSAVVLGHGNVALDCARILAKACAAGERGGAGGSTEEDDARELAATDICSHSVEALRRVRDATGGLRSVVVAGRRGPAQAAFTIKELRELTKLGGARLRVHDGEFARAETEASQAEVKSTRPKKRLYALMHENRSGGDSDDKEVWAGKGGTRAMTDVWLRFLLVPESVVASGEGGAAAAGGVRFACAVLEGHEGAQRAVRMGESAGTGEGGIEEVECGLVLTAIGWRSVAADTSLPFDQKRCVVPTGEGGRVLDEHGLYAAGWLRRGPSGIIGTNIGDGRDVAAAILEDQKEGVFSGDSASSSSSGMGAERLLELVHARHSVDGRQVVDWTGHLNIDASEVAAGKPKGKPREKIIDVGAMLDAALLK